MTKRLSYAALMIGGGDTELVALSSFDWDTANDEADALVEADDNVHTQCLWILDISDLVSLARFFGQHRFQFARELLGGNPAP